MNQAVTSRTFHLHIENSRKRPPLYQLTAPIYAAAVKRHRALAKRLKVTIGWDGEILDEA